MHECVNIIVCLFYYLYNDKLAFCAIIKIFKAYKNILPPFALVILLQLIAHRICTLCIEQSLINYMSVYMSNSVYVEVCINNNV